MFVSRTPYRVSFFGGGTDYTDWFSENGGSFLSMAINKYCYLQYRNLPPFFEYKNRIVWSKIEEVDYISDITHPVVRAALELEKIKNVEIHHIGDLPARSGLGSSSSFAVGMLNVLRYSQGTIATKKQLALDAIELERTILMEAGGIQDQIATAYGGLNYVTIKPSGDFEVSNIHISVEKKVEFENSLLLVFTGIFRNSFEVVDTQIKNMPKSTKQLETISDLTKEACSVFKSDNFIQEFGKLLNLTWLTKKSLSDKITNPLIDEIYDEAIHAGAYGGKLLGAGAGGFMVFVVPPNAMDGVKSRLSKLIKVQVRIDEAGAIVNGTASETYGGKNE